MSQISLGISIFGPVRVSPGTGIATHVPLAARIAPGGVHTPLTAALSAGLRVPLLARTG